MNAIARIAAGSLLSGCLLLAGCASLVERATDNFARDLEAAILDYDEPSVVEQGLPTFILLLESRIQARPDRAAARLAVARLTAAYAGLFTDDPEIARRLTGRALAHAERGACLASPRLCGLRALPFDDFDQTVARLSNNDLDPAYALGTSWASWVAAHRDDFEALAELPRVEALLERVAAEDPAHDDGAVWLYLAVLNSQRPPAAGGRPARALEQYQRALEVSGGRNLLVKVYMADEYARLLFERDLFVELLEEVLAADPDQPGYVLTNRIARQRARDLLARTESIFD